MTDLRVPEDISLALPGLRLAGRRWAGDGPLVVALHGWQDNANSFLPLARHLRAELIALDFPGHGRSQHRAAHEPYELLGYLRAAIGALEVLDRGPVYLLGHSLGGAVSTLLSASRPDLVRSLMLIEALGPLTAPAEETATRLQSAMQASRPARSPRCYASVAEAAAVRAAAGLEDLSAATCLVRRALYATEQGYFWATDRRVRELSAVRFTEAQLLDVIAAVEAQTLVLAGEHSTLLRHDSPGWQRRLAALPNGEQRVLPGGHHLHMTHPGQVARELNAFLEFEHAA